MRQVGYVKRQLVGIKKFMFWV